jgi:hypothetical protein
VIDAFVGNASSGMLLHAAKCVHKPNDSVLKVTPKKHPQFGKCCSQVYLVFNVLGIISLGCYRVSNCTL